ncbi:MAG: zf-HC2 domain-containing protein [Desulfobulbaceae bacterium]|jgi:hypothetical protein|nr:zf-HC2 domain-containing protein [Desulfobulbaceae bacterium]
MKEEKYPDRALVLLALASDEEQKTDRQASAQASGCLIPEEIAAIAEGRLTGERRHRLIRHLAVCPECYRAWLEVARQTVTERRGGVAPAWPWPRLSWKTLGYTGGTMAAMVTCLAIFIHRSPEITYRQQSTSIQVQSPTSVSQAETADNEAKPTTENGDTPSAPNTGGIASTMDEVIKKGDSAPATGSAAGEQTGGQLAAKPMAADKAVEKPNEKHNSIQVGAVEVRRSSNPLTVWYGDLWEMCHQSHFAPEQWTSLYARGADILETLPEDGQNQETDRLWLTLGQMEGLTAERRQRFCAWSNKELARKLGKKK